MSLATLFRHRMQVLHGEAQRTIGGGADYSWTDAGPEYGASLQPMSVNKRVTYLAMDIVATHTLFYDPAEVTLQEKDRIKINDRTFRVLSLKEPLDQRADWPGEAILEETRIP